MAGTPEDGNVLALDDALRALAAPPNPWDGEKAAYIVGRLAKLLGSAAGPYTGIAEASVYHWGVVYEDCQAELREVRVEPRPQRWFLSRARRRRLAEALAAQDRLRQRAYRAWVIRDLFREALRLSADPRNFGAVRLVLTGRNEPGEGGPRKW